MAQAGVTYTWGREGSAQYGESLAGVRAETPLPPVSRGSPEAANGDSAGDLQRPAANRRGRSQSAGLQLPHDLLPRSRQPGSLSQARPLRPGAVRPHGPTCWRPCSANSAAPRTWAKSSRSSPFPTRRPTSTTTARFRRTTSARAGTIPTRSYQRREEIWRDHEEYTQGLFYFLAHDPRVPPSLQKEINEWGLAQGRIRRQRQLAQPTLHPRSAAHGGRVRHDRRRISRPNSPSPTRSAWAPTTAIPTTCSAS